MGTRGKNSIVAAVAAGCVLLLAGVVRLGSDRPADPDGPESGWKLERDGGRVPLALPDEPPKDAASRPRRR